MEFCKRLYFVIISNLIGLVSKPIGPIHSLWTKKRTDYRDVLDLYPTIEKGDIILTRTRGELTTAMIPGFWKHTAMYIGNRRVFESVSPRARRTYLANLIMKTDYYTVLRVPGLSHDEKDAIVDKILKYENKKYDYKLIIRDKYQLELDKIGKSKFGRWLDKILKRPKPEEKIYCSEAPFYAVNEVRPGYLDLVYRMGYPTFSPDDYFNLKEKFIRVKVFTQEEYDNRHSGRSKG